MDMDPVTMAVVTAVVAGAGKLAEKVGGGILDGAGDATKKVVGDAYGALKGLLKKRYGDDSEVAKAVEGVEARPDSEGRKTTLAEEIAAVKADEDPEVRQAAEALLARLREAPGGERLIQSQTAIGDHNTQVAGNSNTVNVNQPPASRP